MLRSDFIERIRRAVYGGYVDDNAEITVGLVNSLINTAVGVAAKQNYKDAIQLDGIGYINNSFYTTFKNLTVVKDEIRLYKIALPELPVGIGKNEGVASLRFKNDKDNISIDCIPITVSQKSYYLWLRSIPNKTMYYTEGSFLYAISNINLTEQTDQHTPKYTAIVGMISGGDSTDMASQLNVPSDYIPIMEQYILGILMKERATPKDLLDDGVDN